MPRIVAAIAALMLCLGIAAPLQAGLYRTEGPLEEEFPVPRSGVGAIGATAFGDYLLEFVQLGNSKFPKYVEGYQACKTEQQRKNFEANLPPEEQTLLKKYLRFYRVRQRYLKRQADLNRLVKREGGTLDDRINLSYYLIRLGQPEEAVGVLNSLRNNRHFMVYANLATAYQMLAGAGRSKDRASNLERASKLRVALDYLSDVQSPAVWPKAWPGWTTQQLNRFREAEKYQARLVRLRWREALVQARFPVKDSEAPFTEVDALFPVKFDGEGGALSVSGASTAGMLGSPLGQGPFLAVSALRSRITEGLKYQAGKLPPLERGKLKGKEVAIVQQLLAWLPTDDRLYWLLGELFNARGDVGPAWQILNDCVTNRHLYNVPQLKAHRNLLSEARPKNRPKPPNLPMPPVTKTEKPVASAGDKASWLPDRGKLILVGAGGGLVLLLLAFFQIRENRRRRQRTQQTSGDSARRT